MKKLEILCFLLVSLAVLNSTLMANTNNSSSFNLSLNKEVAVKIAEAIFICKFGEKILNERPWIVSEDENTIEIKGTFHHPPNTKGGVVELVIQKKDGAVTKLIRGK